MIDLRALRESAEKATPAYERIVEARGCGEPEDFQALLGYENMVKDPAAVLAMVRVCELAKRAHDSVTAFPSAWEADHNAEDLEALHEQLGEALRGME